MSSTPDDWTTAVARSAAGGPDWTVLDHVAHIASWEDFGLDYVVRALDGEPWPTEASIGDFDAFNEAQRHKWTGRSATDVRAWVAEARERLLPALRRVPPDVMRSEAVFGWCYFLVHGHVIEHLAWLEPWQESRRAQGLTPRARRGRSRSDVGRCERERPPLDETLLVRSAAPAKA